MQILRRLIDHWQSYAAWDWYDTSGMPLIFYHWVIRCTPHLISYGCKKVDKHKLSFALTARNLYFSIENWRSLGKIWKPAESLLKPRSFDLVDVKKSILWPNLLWPSSFNPHAEAVNERTVSNFIPWFLFQYFFFSKNTWPFTPTFFLSKITNRMIEINSALF